MDTDTVRESAPEVSTSEAHPHACLEGVVFIGYLVEEDGDEVEIVEAVRQCGHQIVRPVGSALVIVETNDAYRRAICLGRFSCMTTCSA